MSTSFRDTGDVGIVGNVRFRLEQACITSTPNLNVAHIRAGLLEREFRWDLSRSAISGQLRSSRTNNDVSAHLWANSGGAAVPTVNIRVPPHLLRQACPCLNGSAAERQPCERLLNNSSSGAGPIMNKKAITSPPC